MISSNNSDKKENMIAEMLRIITIEVVKGIMQGLHVQTAETTTTTETATTTNTITAEAAEETIAAIIGLEVAIDLVTTTINMTIEEVEIALFRAVEIVILIEIIGGKSKTTTTTTKTTETMIMAAETTTGTTTAVPIMELDIKAAIKTVKIEATTTIATPTMTIWPDQTAQ